MAGGSATKAGRAPARRGLACAAVAPRRVDPAGQPAAHGARPDPALQAAPSRHGSDRGFRLRPRRHRRTARSRRSCRGWSSRSTATACCSPRGLPACTLSEIQPGTTKRALGECCGRAGRLGRFWASVVFPDQRPYPTRGRLLVFNGRRARASRRSSPTSTPPDPFDLVRRSASRSSTSTKASTAPSCLPRSPGPRQLGLRRPHQAHPAAKIHYRGRERSYFNAGCPAPTGPTTASFPLALASFDFAEGEEASALTVTKSCRVKG